jgi:hypothetical protein
MIASTVGMFFVKTKPGLQDFSASYGEYEDPLHVMKRGYRVAMSVGLVGFAWICFQFLNPHQFPRAWLCFFFCGIIGVTVSYLFMEVT